MRIKKHFLAILLAFALIVTACSPVILTQTPKIPERIISTSPSNTEILVGLGLGEKLVAVDTYSTEIPGVPTGIVTLDMMRPDAEVMLALKPDIIFGNYINSLDDDPFSAVAKSGISVVNIPMASSIEQIQGDIMTIAELTDTVKQGEALVIQMNTEMEEVFLKCGYFSFAPSVYFEVSPAPDLYTMGKYTFIDEMITLTGSRNIFGDKDGIFAPSAEDIIAQNPDIIITCVNYLSGDSVGEIMDRVGFQNISAVQNGRVYYVDADLVSRPSQNITRGLLLMAQAIRGIS